MRTLVLGCNGQLGQSMADSVPANVELVGFDLPEVDITDRDSVAKICRDNGPDVIVNAAAYTAVDKAESEPALAASVNADGPRNIARAASEIGAKLIHISTDFVFDGKSSDPYMPDDETNPLNVYGTTKRDGELAVLENSDDSIVIRTSWLYSQYGHNFVKTMLRLMKEQDELRVVDDQVGSPTWCGSLAEVVWSFTESSKHSGLFHWSDHGQISWHEFATAIQAEARSLGLLDRSVPIQAISTDEYPLAAARPRYSALDCSTTAAAINIRPTDWRANLRKMLAQNESANT